MVGLAKARPQLKRWVINTQVVSDNIRNLQTCNLPINPMDKQPCA